MEQTAANTRDKKRQIKDWEGRIVYTHIHGNAIICVTKKEALRMIERESKSGCDMTTLFLLRYSQSNALWIYEADIFGYAESVESIQRLIERARHPKPDQKASA